MQHLQWEGWYNCSRSINTERGSAALVFTRKQKAIARTSVSFQQGGPGFRILARYLFLLRGFHVVNEMSEVARPADLQHQDRKTNGL